MGVFSYLPEETFFSCWFCLNSQAYEDVWTQVSQGHHECTISLTVGPLIAKPPSWVWDVDKNRFLLISRVSMLFERFIG